MVTYLPPLLLLVHLPVTVPLDQQPPPRTQSHVLRPICSTQTMSTDWPPLTLRANRSNTPSSKNSSGTISSRKSRMSVSANFTLQKKRPTYTKYAPFPVSPPLTVQSDVLFLLSLYYLFFLFLFTGQSDRRSSLAFLPL